MSHLLCTLCGRKNIIICWFICVSLSSHAKNVLFTTSVMTFNVENLFDNEDDPNKDDDTYLALAKKQNLRHKQKCKEIKSYQHRKPCYELDWNDSVIDAKLKNIAASILSVEEGRGPDNLFLVEVENQNILAQLNKKYLKRAAYKTIILIPGADPRGINIAFLSRYPIQEQAQLHKILFHPKNVKDKERTEKTRGILDVKIVFPQAGVVRFLGVHFPSQGNPSYLREQAIRYLEKILEKNKTQNIIVGGDFNVTEQEERRKKYLKKLLSPWGLISHFDACNDCNGSHWYKGKWSFLDVLFFSHGLTNNNWTLIKESVQVVKTNRKHFDGKKPIRFDEEKLIGASDHLPVYARLKWNKN